MADRQTDNSSYTDFRSPTNNKRLNTICKKKWNNLKYTNMTHQTTKSEKFRVHFEVHLTLVRRPQRRYDKHTTIFKIIG